MVFLRFCSPDKKNYGFEQEEVNYWMPVDQYIGGVEHAILHLLYSRFFMRAIGYKNREFKFKEPFLDCLLKEWFAMKLIRTKIISGIVPTR